MSVEWSRKIYRFSWVYRTELNDLMIIHMLDVLRGPQKQSRMSPIKMEVR